MIGLQILAIVVAILALPAAFRARRFWLAGEERRAGMEAARAVLALVGALALMAITIMTKGRPA